MKSKLQIGIAADWLGWRNPFILVCFVLAGLGPWMMGPDYHRELIFLETQIFRRLELWQL
jgi:hypothetical protein